jgi:anti-anti-sigma factor
VLTIRTEQYDDGQLVVRPTGDLDAFTVDEFRREFAGITPGERTVIDLSDVTFIDSSGLTALIGAVRRSTERGGRVALACGRPGLARVLRASRLDSIVDIVETLDAALPLVDPGALHQLRLPDAEGPAWTPGSGRATG